MKKSGEKIVIKNYKELNFFFLNSKFKIFPKIINKR
jgi:hypothetical protein